MNIIALILAGIFGLIIGSFLNVVIYRVPHGENIAFPASHCTKCGHKLAWYENIPVFSYIFLLGKCKECKTIISPRYIIVEILNALLWMLCVVFFWQTSVVYSILCMIICSLLLVVAWIDFDHKLIFDRFLLCILVLTIPLIFFDKNIEWWSHLVGLAIGGGLFALIFFTAKLVLKREGLGWGDVKLMAVCGLLLGWKNILLAIILGALLATIILGLYMIFKRKDRNTEFPFAPFLVLGVVIALFWGSNIISWYMGLFG